MSLNRRQFLQVVAGAGISCGLPSVQSAESATDARAKVRPFGFSLYGMKRLPIFEAIDEVARIGYRQIEVPIMPGFPTELAKLTPELRQAIAGRIRSHQLELSSFLLNLNFATDSDASRLANLAHVRAAGQFAREFESKNPPVIETVAGGKAETWDAIRDQLVRRVRACAEAADAFGATLCLKVHADQAINSPERLLWVHRQVAHPRLALTYDYSHLQYAGLPLEETLREILPYTRFLHVKDVTPRLKPARFLLVGTSGTIDYPAYFRLLRTLGYTGPIIAEVSAQLSEKPGYDAIQAARQCHEFIARALAESAG